jgi:DNA-binding CsgD family transcriptional regulator
MKKRFEGFLARLGLKRVAERRSFQLDARLRAALVDLAEQEQRPVEEVQADLLATAITQRQWREWSSRHWQALSPREQDVTAFTCLGYTNRQMAARLGVSPDTVKGYVRQVLVKFNFTSKEEIRMRMGDLDFSKWGPKAQS